MEQADKPQQRTPRVTSTDEAWKALIATLTRAGHSKRGVLPRTVCFQIIRNLETMHD